MKRLALAIVFIVAVVAASITESAFRKDTIRKFNEAVKDDKPLTELLDKRRKLLDLVVNEEDLRSLEEEITRYDASDEKQKKCQETLRKIKRLLS